MDAEGRTGPAQWAQDLAMLHFVDSICDVAAVPPEIESERPYLCTECNVAFASSKQRDLHCRRKHGMRCPQRPFAVVHSNGTAPCPVCSTVFTTRLALLRHLSAARRPSCWSKIIAHPDHYPCMTEARTRELDELDRAARKEGRRAGHSHALVPGGCVRTDGRPCGRTTT